MNSRLKAFEILQSILRDNAYSNLTLEKELKSVNTTDRAFVSKIVYGVIERKLTLDYALDKFLTGKTKPKLKIVLYIGAYQVLFMDKVPAPVAIYETVELAGEVGLSYYKNVVNAVLRKIDGFKQELENIDDLSIKYSCPKNLINMWQKMYGEENTVSILSAINDRPPVFAIPNRKFVTADELQYELFDSGISCEVFGEVVKINGGFDLSECKPFTNGLFYIEDISSYASANVMNISKDDIVLDVCAAPGGKSFTMAQRAKTVYSFDIHEHRVELIKKSAKRLTFDNIIAKVNDATVYNCDLPMANKVLCDVPCSGFGIIRRKPEIRYKNLDEIKELFDIQFAILQTSSRYLLPNGELLYSTCTLNKKENEKVVEKFLKSNPDFSLVKQKTIFPSSDGGDGFFYALMVKHND